MRRLNNLVITITRNILRVNIAYLFTLHLQSVTNPLNIQQSNCVLVREPSPREITTVYGAGTFNRLLGYGVGGGDWLTDRPTGPDLATVRRVHRGGLRHRRW